MLKKKVKSILKGVVKIILVSGFIVLTFLDTTVKAADIKPYILSEKSVNYYENEKVVVIEAGHGGKDSGAIAIDGRYEANMNLELAKSIKKELQKKNIKVEIVRDRDEFISLREKVSITNKINPDLSLQIHFNSSENKTASGAEVFYNTAAYDKYGKVVNEQFSKTIADTQQVQNRGAKLTPFYNRNIKAPSVLLENCFISNANDLEKYDRNKSNLIKNISTFIENILK